MKVLNRPALISTIEDVHTSLGNITSWVEPENGEDDEALMAMMMRAQAAVDELTQKVFAMMARDIIDGRK